MDKHTLTSPLKFPREPRGKLRKRKKNKNTGNLSTRTAARNSGSEFVDFLAKSS